MAHHIHLCYFAISLIAAAVISFSTLRCFCHAFITRAWNTRFLFTSHTSLLPQSTPPRCGTAQGDRCTSSLQFYRHSLSHFNQKFFNFRYKQTSVSTSLLFNRSVRGKLIQQFHKMRQASQRHEATNPTLCLFFCNFHVAARCSNAAGVFLLFWFCFCFWILFYFSFPVCLARERGLMNFAAFLVTFHLLGVLCGCFCLCTCSACVASLVTFNSSLCRSSCVFVLLMLTGGDGELQISLIESLPRIVWHLGVVAWNLLYFC